VYSHYLCTIERIPSVCFLAVHLKSHRFHSLTRLVSCVLSVLVVSGVNVMTLVSSPVSTIFKIDVSTLCLFRGSLLLRSVENTNFQNSKSQYTQEPSNRKTEHRQSRIRDVAEDLNLVPIVTGGFRTFCY